MKEYVVWNVTWLNKFKKGEHVLSDGITDANWEVKVYKVDWDWEPLVNERGNKVSHTLLFARLRPTDVENQYFTAGTLEQRIMNKTFTDEQLDTATDYRVAVEWFADTVNELREKLLDISKNLLTEVNNLNVSADAYDADKFNTVMEHMKKLTEYLWDKPMKDIKELHSKLIPAKKKDAYDPSSILN